MAGEDEGTNIKTVFPGQVFGFNVNDHPQQETLVLIL